MLSYTTPPFAEGATLAGPVSTTVYAASSNTNLQLIAHLYDVAPDGSASDVTQGAILGSLREVDEERTWRDANGTPTWPWQTLREDSSLTPGRVERLDILLEPRQWAVQPGHRLRLELTTRPPAERCPGPQESAPGNDPCYLTTPQQETVPGGTYTILYGPDHPSTLNLPQLPAGHFADAPRSVTPTSDGVCLPQDWGRGGGRR